MKYLLFTAAGLVVLAMGLILVPGLQFSAALCLALALLLTVLYFLHKYATPVTVFLRRLIYVFLILGILAASITEGFIVSTAHPDSQPACDYIIVLGAGVNGSKPSLSLQERIQAAYAYLIAHPNTIAVLSGGQGSGEDITEAACMYGELTAMGIDGSRLLLEEKSSSTMENLAFTMELLQAQSGSRPARMGIVSSEYHLFRAGLFAKALGVESVGIPAKTTWVSLRLNYYLREVAAVWKYLVFGA